MKVLACTPSHVLLANLLPKKIARLSRTVKSAQGPIAFVQGAAPLMWMIVSTVHQDTVVMGIITLCSSSALLIPITT